MSRQEESKRGPRSKRNQEQYQFSDESGSMWLLGLAVGAALSGGAVRIGLTRDGGALALGIYLGDEYGTEYVKPTEDLGQAVREISLAWHIPVAQYDANAGQWLIA